jgi:hypothetical protein
MLGNIVRLSTREESAAARVCSHIHSSKDAVRTWLHPLRSLTFVGIPELFDFLQVPPG